VPVLTATTLAAVGFSHRLKRQFPRAGKKARAAMLTSRLHFAQYASSVNERMESTEGGNEPN
jgi:hypothetical protein